MPTTLTAEDVTRLILDVAARYPDTVNPQDPSGQCMYRLGDAEPGVSIESHCIVGRLAYEQGWTLPPVDDQVINASDAAAEYGWPIDRSARERLVYIQNYADNVGTAPPQPVPWANVARWLRQEDV